MAKMSVPSGDGRKPVERAQACERRRVAWRTTGVEFLLMAIRSIQRGMMVMIARWRVSRGVETADDTCTSTCTILCKRRTDQRDKLSEVWESQGRRVHQTPPSHAPSTLASAILACTK